MPRALPPDQCFVDQQGRRWFGELTRKQRWRSVQRRTDALENAAMRDIAHTDTNPEASVWSNTAGRILDSVHRFCSRPSDSGNYGNAKATYVPPLGAPFLPPPQAITRYCLPSTMYVLGVALPAAGSFASHNRRPLLLSYARILLS